MIGHVLGRIQRSTLFVVALVVALLLGAYLSTPRSDNTEPAKSFVGSSALTLTSAQAVSKSATAGLELAASPFKQKGNRTLQIRNNGPDGIPNGWCDNHVEACTAYHVKGTTMVAAMAGRTVDTVTRDTIPPSLKNAYIGAMTGGAKVAGKGDGGYGDWVDDSDCVTHGYECYFPPPDRPYGKIADWGRGVIVCGGAAIIVKVAGAAGLAGVLALGKARTYCFWTAFTYFANQVFDNKAPVAMPARQHAN